MLETFKKYFCKCNHNFLCTFYFLTYVIPYKVSLIKFLTIISTSPKRSYIVLTNFLMAKKLKEIKLETFDSVNQKYEKFSTWNCLTVAFEIN